MAYTGTALQARVAYLMSRRRGKPALTSKKELALADRVNNRKGRVGEATCLTEMSLMMACWKANAFNDSVCAKEIQAFFTCSSEATADRRTGKNLPNDASRLTTDQVNQLLRRFPNVKREI